MENITFASLFKKGSIISLAKIFVPGILFLAVLCIFSLQSDFHFSTLSRDPIQTLDGKPYVGILSNIGIIFWSATAAILFYTSKLSGLKGNPKNKTFFFCSGLLTVLLLIDDLFLMHDVIFPEYLQIDEKMFYFFYGASVIAIVYFYRVIIKNSDYILLVLAFSLLGISTIMDVILAFGVNFEYTYVIEDGCKFLGIISWFAYFTETSYKYIKPFGLLK